EILVTLIMRLLQGEGDAKIGHLVLFGNGCGRGVQAAAKAAQVGNDFFVGVEGFQVAYSLVGIRFVIDQVQLDGNVGVERFHVDAAGGVNILDCHAVSALYLCAATGEGSGEGYNRADVDDRKSVV